MNIETLTETIAEIIYRYNGGLDPKNYKKITGKEQRIWKAINDFDKNPNVELREWERDEYRTQAKAVIEKLQKEKII